jgi:DNA replication protein DnaC
MEENVRNDFVELLKLKQFRSGEDKATMKWLVNYVVSYEFNDVKRGVTLSGVPGSGKSFFFELFQKFSNLVAINSVLFLREAMKTTDKIYEIGSLEKDLIIDDLGAEVKMIHYGMATELFAEVLMMRYEIWKQENILTFVTTNLSAVEIEERYGKRVADRLFEMTSFITSKNKNMRLFHTEELKNYFK